MLQGVHVHLLLVGAAPVLWLWSLNRSEVTLTTAVPVLASVLGAVAVAFVLSLVALRRVPRAALVTSAAAALVLTHGYLLGDLLPPLAARAGTAVLLVAAVVAIVRADDAALRVGTAVANVVGLALVAVSVPGVVASLRAESAAGESADGASDGALSDEVAAILDGADTHPTRDIFYIVPDRYARADSLAESVGYDNAPFIDFLADRGFEVADQAVSNYPKTGHSLASTLDMDYLDELSTAVPDDQRDSWRTIYGMLDDHLLGQVLTAVGYEYVHVGTWWGPTSSAAAADQVRNYTSRSEFLEVFLSTTAVPQLIGLVTGPEPTTFREITRAHGEWQLDELDRLASEVDDRDDQPRFVFMHIALPHDPYVFDRDGSLVTAAQEEARTREDNYSRQLHYLNSRLRPVIDQLVDQPEETAPIILLQADEGRHPLRLQEDGDEHYAWGEATAADLHDKFRILSAYRLPGVDAGALVREDMTPVNSFRLVLDTYLGTDLGQLEDRAWIFPQPDDLYTFTEVTDVVRGESP